jgi:hypothetical protein
VVATGRRHHTGDGGVQRQQRVKCAARLEGAGVLGEFKLQQHPAGDIELGTVHLKHGGAANLTVQALGRRLEVRSRG